MMCAMRIGVSACLIGLALAGSASAAPKRALDTDVFSPPNKRALDRAGVFDTKRKLDTDVWSTNHRKLDTDVFERRAIDTDVFDEQPQLPHQPRRPLDADVFR